MTALKTVLLIALVWTVVSLRTENWDGVLVPEDARPDVASASSIIAAPSSSNHEDPYVVHFLKDDDDDDLLDSDREDEEEEQAEEEEENESEDEASEWERGMTHTAEEVATGAAEEDESETAEEEEEEEVAETVAEDAETEEAVQAVQEAVRDPPELSDAAAEAHRAVLGSACKTLMDGTDTLRLKGEWCLLRLYVLHLVADRYPGSLSASLAKLGVVTLEDTSPETLEDLDKQLSALMMPTVAAQLNEFMEQHPKSHGWVKAALAKMPRLSDIYKLGIMVAVLTMGFNAEKSAIFTKLWTSVCNNIVTSGAAVQMTTAVMMSLQRIRLSILADAGLERSCRDRWAIAKQLLVLSGPFVSGDDDLAIRRGHARKLLHCYVSETGVSTVKGCEPVARTNEEVQRALDIAVDLETANPTKLVAKAAKAEKKKGALQRVVAKFRKLETADAAAEREEKATRKELTKVLDDATIY